MSAGRTLYDKICAAHTVRRLDDKGHVLLYVDRHFLNEYTSPQAFSALREGGHRVWRPRASLAVVDHVNSTAPQRTSVINVSRQGARTLGRLASRLALGEGLFAHARSAEYRR